MLHLPNEILRRYVDEPEVLLGYEKEHLLQCPSCRARLERLRSHANFAAGALAGSDDVAMAEARQAIVARASAHGSSIRLRAAGGASAGTATRPLAASTLAKWTAAIAAGVAIVLFAAYAPLRTYAQNFLTIFEPHAFRAVGLTPSDVSKLQGLPNLNAFGTMHQASRPRFAEFADASIASRHARMPIASPAYLPAAVPRRPSYRVSAVAAATFTFSAARARAFAKRKGASVPALPANLDGARLTATVGPVVVQTYGRNSAWMQHPTQNEVHRRVRTIHHEGFHALPADTIIVTQARAPKVVSTGATVAQIESYLLNLPGVPADLANQIRAIGDPTHTVPVPFRIDKENAQTVTVQGAQALLVGDNTGVGSGVMWQKNGTVYAVAGPFTADEILRVANSLKI